MTCKDRQYQRKKRRKEGTLQWHYSTHSRMMTNREKATLKQKEQHDKLNSTQIAGVW